MIEEEQELYYRSKSGKRVALDPADYGSLVSARSAVLYKNPREGCHDDGYRAGKWYPSYNLMLSDAGSRAAMAKELDRLIDEGYRISEKATAGLREFRGAIHAARIQHVSSPGLQKIKAEVNAKRPTVAALVLQFARAADRWRKQAADLLARETGKEEEALVRAVITAATPEIGWGLGLEQAKTVLKIDDLIYHRPEVLSVDPGGWWLRVAIDVSTLIENGGTMVGYELSLRSLFRFHGVEGEVSIERHDHKDALLKRIVDTILGPVIGRSNIKQWGYGGSDSDPSASFDFYVAPGLEQAGEAMIPAIQALLAPYAFQNYSRNIKFKTLSR